MFNIIRLKIAKHLAEKASACIRKGDFRNIKKGLKYFKMSVKMVPIAEDSYDEWTKLRSEIFESVRIIHETLHI